MNMPIFTGDARDIEPLQILCRLLLDNGAWLHRELVIHAEGGDLSLRSARPDAGRASYLRVPVGLMPALQDFTLLTDQDRQLYAVPARNDIDPLQQRMMQLMLELYNQTGKLAQWEASYPGFAWQGQDALMQHLFSARPSNTCQPIHAAVQKQDNIEAVLPHSFMGSRKFLLRSQFSGRTDDVHVLMPLVDCLNHHPLADGYKVHETPRPSVMRILTHPQSEQGELFVSYNLFDAVDTLLNYGFVDCQTPFFYSVPCSVQVGQYNLEIQQRRLIKSPVRHPRLRALGLRAAQVESGGTQALNISGLVIPDADNIDQLRLAAAAIGEISGLVKSHKDMEIFVRGFEAKVIEYNSQWWQTLRELTGHLDAQHPAAQLAARGCAHLESYAAAIARLH